jgi:DNA-binding transcriptional ArsR family regulator
MDFRNKMSIFHVMKTSAPPLLPILRSPHQARILTKVLLTADREFTLSELAEETGASLPTVTREVSRAQEAGIVTVRRRGPTKLVTAERRSVLFGPLSQLLLLAFGPAALVAEAFRDIQGIEGVFIFGSWAARYEGEKGPAPRDLDVLVVGDPEREAIYRAADRVESELRRQCQVTLRSAAQWAAPENDPFIQEVKRRPLVEVLPAERGRQP